jgi:hypothetical protein
MIIEHCNVILIAFKNVVKVRYCEYAVGEMTPRVCMPAWVQDIMGSREILILTQVCSVLRPVFCSLTKLGKIKFAGSWVRSGLPQLCNLILLYAEGSMLMVRKLLPLTE